MFVQCRSQLSLGNNNYQSFEDLKLKQSRIIFCKFVIIISIVDDKLSMINGKRNMTNYFTRIDDKL